MARQHFRWSFVAFECRLALLGMAIAAVIIPGWKITKGYDYFSQVRWGMLLKIMLLQCWSKKFGICCYRAKDFKTCMCLWLLPFDSVKTAEWAYLLPNVLWVRWYTLKSARSWMAAWSQWEKQSILLTDDIELWPPPSPLADEEYFIDWWQQHLKNPPFSHPTSINWTAPRRQNLLSKILMCQYIYGGIFLQGDGKSLNIQTCIFLEYGVYNSHLVSEEISCVLGFWNPYVQPSHPPPVLLYFWWTSHAGTVQTQGYSPSICHLSATCHLAVVITQA